MMMSDSDVEAPFECEAGQQSEQNKKRRVGWKIALLFGSAALVGFCLVGPLIKHGNDHHLEKFTFAGAPKLRHPTTAMRGSTVQASVEQAQKLEVAHMMQMLKQKGGDKEIENKLSRLEAELTNVERSEEDINVQSTAESPLLQPYQVIMGAFGALGSIFGAIAMRPASTETQQDRRSVLAGAAASAASLIALTPQPSYAFGREKLKTKKEIEAEKKKKRAAAKKKNAPAVAKTSSLGYEVKLITRQELVAEAKKLTPSQRAIALNRETEKPFTGKTTNGYAWDNKEEGYYVGAISGLPLFSSKDLLSMTKKTGWPAFKDTVAKEHVILKKDQDSPDYSSISFRWSNRALIRTEILDANSGAHLGWQFKDAPSKGTRFAINTAALTFVPSKGGEVPDKNPKKEEKKADAA